MTGSLLLGLLLFLPLCSFAQPICFNDETASRLVVTLEQCKITEQQLVVQNNGIAELEQQKSILAETVKLLQDQILLYKNMDEMKNQMSVAKDKACDAAVKAATPTFWSNVQKYSVGAVGGAVLLGLAILLL